MMRGAEAELCEPGRSPQAAPSPGRAAFPETPGQAPISYTGER